MQNRSIFTSGHKLLDSLLSTVYPTKAYLMNECKWLVSSHRIVYPCHMYEQGVTAGKTEKNSKIKMKQDQTEKAICL